MLVGLLSTRELDTPERWGATEPCVVLGKS